MHIELNIIKCDQTKNIQNHKDLQEKEKGKQQQQKQQPQRRRVSCKNQAAHKQKSLYNNSFN